MLLCCNKYLNRFLLKPLVTIGFIFSFSIAASAQAYNANEVGKYPRMNPLLYAAFKKPLKPNPLLSEYAKPSKYELMYWPNFPLTPAQIEARNREWERKNRQTIGEPLIYTLQKSSSSDRRNLVNIVKRHNTDKSKVQELIDMVVASGGIDYASRKMEEFRDEALGVLFTFPQSDTRNSLQELVEYTINRKK